MNRRLFLQRSGALAVFAASGRVLAQGAMPSLDEDATRRLVDFISKEMSVRHIPGLSACLVHTDGRILWSQNFGYANLESHEAMSFNHLQNVASISKTIVTLAAMQQVESGLMSLDDNINRYLPFQLQHPKHPDQEITVRMLMRHESAIRDGSVYTQNYACGDPRMSLGVWVREYFEKGGIFYTADENFAPWAPGERYEYANTSFGLLGHIVERTSGLSFPDYCERNIIAPMGLTGTDAASGAENAVTAVAKLARDVGLPSFASFGVDPADFDMIAENSVKNGSNASNPRPMQAADYLAVLNSLQTGA